MSDFESRLHSTPMNSGDVVSYISEGNIYLTGFKVDFGQSGKWEREARRQKYSFSQAPVDITGQIFGLSIGGGAFNTPSLSDDGSSHLLWTWSFANPTTWNLIAAPSANLSASGVSGSVAGSARSVLTGTIGDTYWIQGITAGVPSTNVSNSDTFGT